jgi:YVTN family beta-propeller protein
MRKILRLLAIAFVFSSGPSAQSRSSVPGKVYTTSWFGAMISVVDLGSGKAVKTIPVGVQDHNIFLSPDQKTAWVANNNEGTVSLIDTATDSVVGKIQTGHGPRHTNMPADGHVAYVTNEFDDALAVIDPTTRKVVQTIKSATCRTFQSWPATRSSSATSVAPI